MPPEFVVAIDGPAGAGKSSVARRLAGSLDGFSFLDTGAMYRAVAAYLLDHPGAEPAQAAAGLELAGGRLLVHGEDVTDRIRTAAVTRTVSASAALPSVRRIVQDKQRDRNGRLVAEGRDIGTVVFPGAAVKIYLDASLEERARRRAAEAPGTVAEHAAAIKKRDAEDMNRADSPLKVAPGAVRIGTDELTVDEVVAMIRALVEARLRRLLP